MNNLIGIASGLLMAPIWVSNSFKYVRIVLVSLIIVLSILLIVSIMLQPPKQEGIGAIGGGSSDTFFSKNKGRTREGMLKKLTIGCGIAIFVIAVLYFVTLMVDQSQITKETTEGAVKLIGSLMG